MIYKWCLTVWLNRAKLHVPNMYYAGKEILCFLPVPTVYSKLSTAFPCFLSYKSPWPPLWNREVDNCQFNSGKDQSLLPYVGLVTMVTDR